jgi:hypothetical protein
MNVRASEANARSGHQHAGSNSDSNATTPSQCGKQTDLRHSISVITMRHNYQPQLRQR